MPVKWVNVRPICWRHIDSSVISVNVWRPCQLHIKITDNASECFTSILVTLRVTDDAGLIYDDDDSSHWQCQWMFDASRDISKCSTSMSTKHRVANDAKLCLTPLKTHVFHRVRTSNSPAMLSALLHRVYDLLEQGPPRGDSICMRTLSSHCRGPFRCISIQHGALVTVCRLKQKRYVLYSAISSP